MKRLGNDIDRYTKEGDRQAEIIYQLKTSARDKDEKIVALEEKIREMQSSSSGQNSTLLLDDHLSIQCKTSATAPQSFAQRQTPERDSTPTTINESNAPNAISPMVATPPEPLLSKINTKTVGGEHNGSSIEPGIEYDNTSAAGYKCFGSVTYANEQRLGGGKNVRPTDFCSGSGSGGASFCMLAFHDTPGKSINDGPAAMETRLDDLPTTSQITVEKSNSREAEVMEDVGNKCFKCKCSLSWVSVCIVFFCIFSLHSITPSMRAMMQWVWRQRRPTIP
jgi:hypothetical protein